MSRKGNCLDNSMMENFFRIMKSELLYAEKFESPEDFTKALEGYIDYFRFSSVGFNRLKNKLLAEYLRNRGNELATVQISAICGAMLSNNSL